MIYIKQIESLENSFGDTVNLDPLPPFHLIPLDINTVNKAAKKIGEYIGLGKYIFVVNNKRLDEKTGAHIELQHEENYVFLEISENLDNELSILAALSHELSHKFLHIHGFYSGLNNQSTLESEIFTDITAVYLGLGKLMLNGCKVDISYGKHSITQSIGYLDRDQLAYVYYLVCKMREIPTTVYQHDLTPDAKNAVSKWFNTDFDKSQKLGILALKDICEFYKMRKSMDTSLVAINDRIRFAKSNVDKLLSQLSLTKQNQDRINRTHWFWDVSEKDDKKFAEFTIANYLGDNPATLVKMEKVLNNLETQRVTLVRNIKTLGEKQKRLLLPFQKNMISLDNKLKLIENQISSISTQLETINNLQKKYFSKINLIKTKCGDVQNQIKEYKEMFNEVFSLNKYFQGNLQVWDIYKKDKALWIEIQNLIESEEFSKQLALTYDWVRATEQLLGSLQNIDPEYFPKNTNLSIIQSRLEGEYQDLAKNIDQLANIRKSQKNEIAHFLKRNMELLDKLDEIFDVIKDEEKILDLIRKRQIWIFDRHQVLEIDTKDEEEFNAITRSIYTCNFEGELSRIRRITEKITNEVHSNIENIQGLREASKVISIDVFEEEYQQDFNSLEEIKNQISKWRALQLKYYKKWKKQGGSISNQFMKILKKKK